MCTDLYLPAASPFRVSGRTLDFDSTPAWSVLAVPNGIQQRGIGVFGGTREAARWEAHYPFLGVGLQIPSSIADRFPGLETKCPDAMNDRGLSAAALWLPTSVYPTLKAAPDGAAMLSALDIVPWAVSNYGTVDELDRDLRAICDRRAISSGQLLAFWNPLQEGSADSLTQSDEIHSFRSWLPLHFQFHDAHGKSLVLEFRDQSVEVTDNSSVGVLTNFPFLDWHILNLGNYLSVSNLEVKQVDILGLPVERSGNGCGFSALSTSALPSDRFVRSVLLLNYAQLHMQRFSSISEASAFVEALLGNLAVPLGMVAECAVHLNGDFTQWMVVREHRASQPEHSRYYVSTFKSLGPWTVGFEDFDLTRGAPVVSLPLADQLHPPIFPSQEDLYEL